MPRTVLLVEHRVDQVPLQYGTMLYTNEAGHVYSVSRLEYFLSELVLVGAAGTPDHVVAGPWYINGALGNAFDLGVLPPGSFSGATVQLGLPPALNLSDALPATMAHVNMAWPGPMGGGYHFLKFEGHFLHNGSPTGFAMHLGRNENLVHGAMPGAFTRDGTADSLVLRFNLNEVFRSPHTYDLVTGTQSMGSMVLMGLLRDNTADAFSLEHRP
ncbi:MAG: hypothetical protein KBH07_02190 [Flavobacteriales bacterium]|nr:hypothetical protein [Flavobacteriales bacterium]MBP9078945.1 hypothetical protein [Flavobacteriales bacterium]